MPRANAELWKRAAALEWEAVGADWAEDSARAAQLLTEAAALYEKIGTRRAMLRATVARRLAGKRQAENSEKTARNSEKPEATDAVKP